MNKNQHALKAVSWARTQQTGKTEGDYLNLSETPAFLVNALNGVHVC